MPALNPNSLDNKSSCWILKNFHFSVTMLVTGRKRPTPFKMASPICYVSLQPELDSIQIPQVPQTSPIQKEPPTQLCSCTPLVGKHLNFTTQKQLPNTYQSQYNNATLSSNLFVIVTSHFHLTFQEHDNQDKSCFLGLTRSSS